MQTIIVDFLKHFCPKVLYGTSDGRIGLVQLTRQGPNSQWLLEGGMGSGSGAAVQCLDNFDITGDGVRDLLVGRHDGSIEVQIQPF